MSADSALIQAMLTQQLQQSANGGSQGGQPGRVSPFNAAATLAQKAMLVRALQNGAATQQQRQANQMMPGSQAQMATDPTLRAMQQPAASGMVLSPDQLNQLQQPVNPIALPPEGYS